jgi:hypothetical protein
VDPCWTGRHRSAQLATDFFPESDFSRRAQLIRDARAGGSITPPMMDWVQRATAEGYLEVLAPAQIESCDWVGVWKVEVVQEVIKDEIASCVRRCLAPDAIWMATGR